MPQAHGTQQHRRCPRCSERRPRRGFRAGLCQVCTQALLDALPKESLALAIFEALPEIHPRVRRTIYARLGLHVPAVDEAPQNLQEAG